MITDLHILKSLHNVIKKYFPDIPITDKDLKTIKRPAFYITDITRKDTNISSEFFESTKAFNITYFGSDTKTGNVELVKIKEFLSNIFLKPIKINISTTKQCKTLFYVEVDSIDINVNRQENYVSCDLIIILQQRKLNVLISEEPEIIVDYENNLDSETYNKETMDKLEAEAKIGGNSNDSNIEN
jgi:hypothetical protein